MDFEAVGGEHLCADQDGFTSNKGGLDLDGFAVKGNFHKLRIFRRGLTAAELRQDHSNKARRKGVEKVVRQFNVAVETGVHQCEPDAATDFQLDDWLIRLVDAPLDHRRAPLR